MGHAPLLTEPTSVTSRARDRVGQLGCCLGLAALLSACTGGIREDSYPSGSEQPGATSGGEPTVGAGGSGGADADASNTAAGPGSTSATSGGGSTGGSASGGETVVLDFTRLTRSEYRATIEQALGATPDVNLLPEDGRVGRYTSNHEVTPDPVHPYLLASEELAAALVPESLPACDSGESSACVEQTYAEALAALFRRDLVDADVATLGTVIDAVFAGGGSADDATRAMLTAALLSPDFLYRTSPSAGDPALGEGANLGRRLAERLSFALWDAPPDAELTQNLSASATDAEALAEALLTEAARATRDPRAVPVLARFFGQWLDVDTDLRLEDPDFESSADYLELLAFVEAAVADGAPVQEFVGGRRGFAHQDNLDLYDLGDGEGSGDVVSVTFADASSRRGLLGHELFAGSTRHPDHSRREIFRGLLVRRSLLCDEIPPPDPELVALAGEVEDRTDDGRCRNCHLRLDPIGRAFADLDPDNEAAVPEAELIDQEEIEGTYASAGALLEAVSTSRAFAECFSRHWLAFFLEQPLNSIDEAWTATLADRVHGGASLGDVVEATVAELHDRSAALVPWCEGS